MKYTIHEIGLFKQHEAQRRQSARMVKESAELVNRLKQPPGPPPAYELPWPKEGEDITHLSDDGHLHWGERVVSAEKAKTNLNLLRLSAVPRKADAPDKVETYLAG